MPTIAEILHEAADKHLAVDIYERYQDTTKFRFSCDAVFWACEDMKQFKRIQEGLENLGCPVKSSDAFKNLGYSDNTVDSETQGARYIWLKFAALMAEEQGV